MNRGLFSKLSRRTPDFEAYVRGDVSNSSLRAHLTFHARCDGMTVCITAEDLPYTDGKEEEYVFVVVSGTHEYELPPAYSGTGLIEAMFLTSRISSELLSSSAVVLYMTRDGDVPLMIGSGIIREG